MDKNNNNTPMKEGWLHSHALHKVRVVAVLHFPRRKIAKGNLLPLTDKFLCVNKGRYITGSSSRTSSPLFKETPLS